MENNAIEIFESPDKKARFYFSYSSTNLTTGVLVLQPGAVLEKHNRPHAIENLTQVSGMCLMTLFDESDTQNEIKLHVGDGIRMPKGQWHIHSNPFKQISITLFITQGDILEIMKHLKKSNVKINSINDNR